MSPSSFAPRMSRLRLCTTAAMLFQTWVWLALLCLSSLCPSPLSAQGIAKPLLFTGNTTVIAPPTADTEYAFGPRDFGVLYRWADCSVSAIIATANGGSMPVTVRSVTEYYQDTLHTLAGLTTKGDIWPNGCGNPGANNPAYFAADAGQASNKSYVVATLDMVDPNVIDIFNVKGGLIKPTVTKVQTWNIGPNVFSIAGVNLNGDGLADLVVGSTGNFSPKLNGGYAVLINKGDGTFNAPTFVALPGEGIIALAMADVNHDNKPDLIALEQPPNGGKFQVGIFLGDGKGGFTEKKTYPLKGFAISLVAADLNDDGHPDLIFSDGELLLGNGDGTFKTGKALPLPTSVASLVAADFNHDKKIDLAVVTYTDEVAVFLGNGNGTLQAPTSYSGVYQGQVITAGDLDGDGNLDLILGPQSGGGLSPTPNAMGGTGGLGVLMGAGDGTFKGALSYPTGSIQSNLAYAIADINGDGKPDILTASSLLVGDGTGHFTVKPGNQFPGLTNNVGSVIRVADLNNDKKPDAVVTTTDTQGNPSTAHVFLGQAAGKFGAGTTLSVPNVLDVAIADFNGDNIPDLAVLSYTMGSGISLHVLLGKGNGSFGTPIAVSLPSGTAQSTGGRIFTADFNNDKKTDLLLLDVGDPFKASVTGGTYVFLGDGKGGLNLSATITEVNNPFDAAIADFNKDGKLDLVLSSTDFNGSFSTPPLIFLGSGKGTFGTGKPLPTVSTIPLHMVAADIDGDGKMDLVIGNCCGLAAMSVVFGKGNGSFVAEQIFQVAGSPSQIAVADLNGDKRPDIVISSGTALGTLNEYGVVSSKDEP
jgi:FG-GAP-like repeat